MPRRMGGALTPGERSRFFFREGWAYWARDPLGAAGTTLRKCLALCTAHEIPRNQSMYEGRRHSRMLAALVWKWGGFAFPFGLLGPLALAGLVCARRRNPELTLLVVVVGVYAIGIVAFFPVARYRVPLVPLLACAAAVGVREIAEAVRSSRRTRSVLTVLAVLTGAAVLVDGGWVRARWDPAVDAFTRAWTHQQRGRPAAAIAELEHALVLDPGHQEALANLAALYGMRGEAARSADTARRALALDPDRPRAWVNLANAQLMLGQPAEAESSLTRALTLQPDLPEAWTACLRLARGPESEERVPRLARLATETWPRELRVARRAGRARAAARCPGAGRSLRP